jgi:hypothetical protein
LSFLSGLCATKGHKQSAGQTCMKGFGAVPLQAVLHLVTMEAARKTQQMLPSYLSCLACVPQRVTNTSRYIARQTCMRSIMPCHRRLPYSTIWCKETIAAGGHQTICDLVWHLRTCSGAPWPTLPPLLLLLQLLQLTSCASP